MIESYLSMYMHPRRVGNILSVVNDLSHLGLDQVGQTVENMIMSGSVSGSDGVIGDIEQTIEVALIAAFAQFGVTLDYDDSKIPEQLELLNFLAQWDTPEGYSKASVNLPEGINELASTDQDRLLVLFAQATGKAEYEYIDWLDGVEPYLIAVINGTLTGGDEDDSHDTSGALITDSILNPFRSFAAHYADSVPVSYVRTGGALGINFARLIEANMPLLDINEHEQYATSVVGFAMLSDMPRNNINDAVNHFIELTYGQNDVARRVMGKAKAILSNLGF